MRLRCRFSLIFGTMKAWSIPLLPFAGLYGAVMALRNWAYDRGWKRSHAVGIPVVSIGNITVGGTGKTPMAEFLLGQLCAMGLKPAYLSRGYGRQTKGFLLVAAASGDAAMYGDEAFQVAHKFPQVPVAVCEDRVAGARQLIAAHRPDILVLDDAFQHRRIGRALDWVMIDASRMPTRDWPIPAGRLREALRGLRRAQTLVVAKAASPAAQAAATAALAARFPDVHIAAFALQPTCVQPFAQAADAPAQPINALDHMPVVLFSGIGNPGHFESTVQGTGASVCASLAFPDHHRYTEADLEKILAAFESQKEIKGKLPPALILTTEKDYFRLKGLPWMRRFAHLPLAYLAVGMVPVTGWEQMAVQLNTIIKDVRHDG